jgi:TP901-1 family phage major tail protein
MAKYAGEDLTLTVENTGYQLVGGASEHTMTINNETVDTTDKDSSRWGESKPFGKRSVSVSMSGFVSDNAQFAVLEAAVQADTLVDCQLAYGNSKTATGNWHISSFEYTGSNNDAQQFSLTLESDGEITFA